MQMSRADQLAYERHLDALAVQSDAFDAARIEGHAEGHELGLAEGRAEGRAEGLAEGRAEGRAEGELSKAKSIARKMKEMGATPDFIIQATGLTAKDIDKL